MTDPGQWLKVHIFAGPNSVSVGARLGMMMLGGIVVNHSIMLMDRIDYYVQKKNMTHIRAAVAANRDRLRPILMTMTTTVLGLVPMAIDRTEGANLWSPLALTVIGGVVSSTILTLMVTPAFYILFNEVIHFVRTGEITTWTKAGFIALESPKIFEEKKSVLE